MYRRVLQSVLVPLLVCVGLALAAVGLLAPKIGLGENENFLLYKSFGLSRLNAFYIGIADVAVFSVAWIRMLHGSVFTKWTAFANLAYRVNFLFFAKLSPNEPETIVSGEVLRQKEILKVEETFRCTAPLPVRLTWLTLAAIFLLIAISISPAILNGSVFNGLDGDYFKIYLRQTSLWQSHDFVLGADPVRGSGNLTFPLFPERIFPFFLSNCLFGDVQPIFVTWIQSLALLLAVVAVSDALGLGFAAGLLGGICLGLFASPAVWPPAIWPMFGLSPHFADQITCLAFLFWLFVRIGRGGPVADVLRSVALACLSFYFALTNPLLGVVCVAAGAFICVGALADARSRYEAAAKIFVGILLVAAAAVSGVVEFLLGIVEFTVPAFMGGELVRNQDSLTLVSIIFQHSRFDWIPQLIVFASLVEASIRLRKRQGNSQFAILGFTLFVPTLTVGGAIFLFAFPDWRGPPVIYFELGVWPFYVALAASLIIRLCVFTLAALMTVGTQRTGNRLRTRQLVPYLPAVLAAAAGFLAVLTSHFEPVSYAPFPPQQTAISQYLRDALSIRNDGLFKGRLATLIGATRQDALSWNVLHGLDSQLYKSYGTDLRFIGPWNDDVPTLQEYSQAITPPMFLLQSRFFARPDDRQIRNISLLTRPDIELFKSWGVRYIVYEGEIEGMSPILQDATGVRNLNLKLYRLDSPNTGVYSPTQISVVDDFSGAMEFLRKNPNLRNAAVVFEPTIGPFGNASASITYGPGYADLAVQSDGSGFLLLPLEYSRCLSISGPGQARLVRANVAQAAVTVERGGTYRLTLRNGPFENPACRRDDAKDMKRLNITGAAGKFAPGIGR